MISVFILLIVFILIAIRQVGNIRLQIWQIMLLGALAVLVTGQISLGNAFKSINPDVMFFLFGMFIVGQALEESGYLAHLSHRFCHRVRTLDGLVLFILFGMGISSAFLMNDTVAIIAIPVVLLFAQKLKVNSKILLLTLAFAVTIGSVASPIGNPQNLLITIYGNMTNPFLTFLKFLLIPTVLNLFLAYLLLRFYYRKHFHRELLNHDLGQFEIKDEKLAGLSRVSLILLVILILARVVMVFLDFNIDFRLIYIALISAVPIVVLSSKRLKIIRGIDWSTLIFFAAMFILMASVWDSGFFQAALNGTHLSLTSANVIMVVSVLLSQLISNVPLVALYLPMLSHLGVSTKEMMALAAGSTIAGNFSILGAASNVIIIQSAERKAGETLTFLEFVKIGVPLTVVNLVVYWFFLSVI